MSRAIYADIDEARKSADAVALGTLGARLLSGVDVVFDPGTGAELLASAAGLGNAEACAHIAVLAGAGVCRPQSWETALDYLQRAAELGWPAAQAQLLLLAADRDLAERFAAAGSATPADWRLLRQTVDLPAWIAAPPKLALSDAPRIWQLKGFASPALCGWLIARARAKLRRAQTYDAATGASAIGDSRTNRETDFNIVETDVPMLLVRARIAEATGLPPAVMELTKVLHYASGQQFAPHFDFIDPSTPALAREVSERGQRLVTLLIYLNDDFDGGETDFPQIGLRYKGYCGDALLFANVEPDGRLDRRTLHAGLAPTRGEKWLLSQWIRDRVPAGR